MRVLILYRELAAYLIPSINDIVVNHNAKITLVVYEVNAEAPFVFSEQFGINVVKKCNFDFVKSKLNYDLIFCSGWADNDYLRYIGSASKDTVKVICFDSEYKMTLRKILGSFYLRLFVKPRFDFAFVPGSSSFRFAKLIGFSKSSIFRGLYSADVETYSSARVHFCNRNFLARPCRFLFVGRYVKQKGIQELYTAFLKFCELSNDNWELLCVGTGPERLNSVEHRNILHLGFLQPHELVGILEEVDVFVMPSHSEPWGVVLHEMVLAGLPVLVSDSVNSRELFLADGINGLEFKAQSTDELLAKMVQITEMYRNNRQTMILKSRELGSLISNNNWSLLINRVIK